MKATAGPYGPDEPEWRTIVGVVADLMPGGLENPGAEAVYVPVAQEAPWSFRVAVRSDGAALALADAVRAAISAVDPDLTFSFGTPLDRSIRMANGGLAGLVFAAPLAWLLGSMLFDVRPFDPLVFGTVLGVLLAAGTIRLHPAGAARHPRQPAVRAGGGVARSRGWAARNDVVTRDAAGARRPR